VAFIELFSPLYLQLECLLQSIHFLPYDLHQPVQTTHTHLCSILTRHLDTRKPLRLQQHKAIPLTTLEPLFDDHYSLDQHSRKNSRQEIKKLRHVHQREFKGAIRELRKDTRFLANVQLERQLEQDKLYQKKVHSILHQLELQQHTYPSNTS
jgi:nucleolar protein 14